MTDRVHELLNFWFGHLGSADLPTSDRTNLWFGDNDEQKKQLIQAFVGEFEAASLGQLKDWQDTPRGRLALIILYDQFPRYLHRRTSQAFAYDEEAQRLCVEGLRDKMDQTLTLIERVFFLHAVSACRISRFSRAIYSLVSRPSRVIDE